MKRHCGAFAAGPRERTLYLFPVAIAARLRQLPRLEAEALALLFVTKQHDAGLAQKNGAPRDQQDDHGRDDVRRNEPIQSAVLVQGSNVI